MLIFRCTGHEMHYCPGTEAFVLQRIVDIYVNKRVKTASRLQLVSSPNAYCRRRSILALSSIFLRSSTARTHYHYRHNHPTSLAPKSPNLSSPQHPHPRHQSPPPSPPYSKHTATPSPPPPPPHDSPWPPPDTNSHPTRSSHPHS